MPPWFSGGISDAPKTPVQAASLLIDASVSEHEAGKRTLASSSPVGALHKVNKIDINSSYALVRRNELTSTCHLCFFPTGALYNLIQCEKIHAVASLTSKGLHAFVFNASEEPSDNESWLHVYERGELLAQVGLAEKTIFVELESRDRLAVGHEGQVGVYDRQRKTYVQTYSINLLGNNPVVGRFSAETLVLGTKNGRVFGHNLRTNTFDWCFQAVGRGSVHDIQMARGLVYVSSGGGLWVWDMRGEGKLRRQFQGHRNLRKKPKFDVDVWLGLLAAGCNDGVVRLWDCRKGGEPLAELEFPDEILVSVKLVSENAEDGGNLGLWVETRSKLYTCVVGCNRFP